MIPLLTALDRQMRKYRCVSVRICGCGFQAEICIFNAALYASGQPLPSAGGTIQGVVKPNHSVLSYQNQRSGGSHLSLTLALPPPLSLSRSICVRVCVGGGGACACMRLAPMLASCQSTYLTVIHRTTHCDS